MKDRVMMDEARYDRDCELAREVLVAQIDEIMDVVWKEVDAGEHDRELFSSSWFDQTMVSRMARRVAAGQDQLAGDLADYSLQLTDYVRDVAELRAE